MSRHGFSKSSISTFIFTYLSALVQYYISKGFKQFETEEGGIDNIPISVKIQINVDNLHPKEIILRRKA